MQSVVSCRLRLLAALRPCRRDSGHHCRLLSHSSGGDRSSNKHKNSDASSRLAVQDSDRALALAEKANSLWHKLSYLKPDSPPDSRLLKVAVLGPTDVGKSSLVNMLASYRSCAVSQRINTTRSKQAVITTRGNTQLIFVDLPGLLSEQRRRKFNLENYIMRDVHSGIFQADLILVMVDVSHPLSRSRMDPEILKALHYFADKPSVLVLNKIDLLRGSRTKLLDTVRALTDGVVAGRVSHIDRYASRIQLIDEQVRTLLASEGRVQAPSLPQAPSTEGVLTTSANNFHGLWDLKWERYLVPPVEELQRHLVPPPDVLMWGSNPPAPTPMLSAESLRTLMLASASESPESIEAIEAAEDERLLSAEPDSSESEAAPDGEDSDLLPALADGTPKVPKLSKLDSFTLWLREQMLLGSVTKAEALTRRKRWREIARLIAGQASWRGFQDAFMVSAATGEGVDQLRDYLFSISVPSPWLFHSSCLSDMEPADMVRMCIWARCLDILPMEVPYKLDFELQNLDRSGDGRVFISVVIHCASLRALASVIGQDGGIIKEIAQKSKEELQDVFRANVTLKLAAVRSTIPGGHLSRIKKAKSFTELFPEVMH